MERILNKEGIRFENDVLLDIIQKEYPDIRKIINELQGHSNGNILVYNKNSTFEESIHMVMLDTRMYLTFNNIKGKEFYDQIYNRLEMKVSYRQFNHLLKGENMNKVSSAKRQAVINCIQELIPVKKWHHEYMKLQN